MYIYQSSVVLPILSWDRILHKLLYRFESNLTLRKLSKSYFNYAHFQYNPSLKVISIYTYSGINVAIEIKPSWYVIALIKKQWKSASDYP